MYAIVKAGGHQEKVEVGDVILVNRLDAKKGDTVEFPVSLVVDGDKVTLAAADLAKVSVKAEVVNDEANGPKILPNTHICQYNTVITADKFRK